MTSDDDRVHPELYLRRIGVADLPPSTSPFDPGYDASTLEGHLEQSSHLMSALKLSMSCWQIANEAVTRRKIEAARAHGVPTVTGGGPFEIAAASGELAAYLDLCADMRVTRIEGGEGFTDLDESPAAIVRMAHQRGLQVQFELGKKHEGAFTEDVLKHLIARGREWLDAGAFQLVIEARESARGVGLFNASGELNERFADRLVDVFGHGTVVFEAPDKPSQFALLKHLGPHVHLSNVRLEELLRVEIYRRGLHSDSFGLEQLRPRKT